MDFVNPTYDAHDILKIYLGKSMAKLAIQLARSGTHVFNPYHNLTHELQVVYWTHACIVNDPSYDPDSDILGPALIAALFHDHNHSGGRTTDAENVAAAMQFVTTHLSHELGGTSLRPATIIEATRYDGVDKGFFREPTNLAERAIRDADLMSIYSHEGRQLLTGLVEEITGKTWLQLAQVNEADGVLKVSAEFLRTAKMYTPYGKSIKSRNLEASLREFERMVRDEIRHGDDNLVSSIYSSGSENV